MNFDSSEAQCAQHWLAMMRLPVRSAHELSTVELLATSQQFTLHDCKLVIEMSYATASYKLLTIMKHV